jgi:hypothetical protein
MCFLKNPLYMCEEIVDFFGSMRDAEEECEEKPCTREEPKGARKSVHEGMVVCSFTVATLYDLV